MERLEVFWHARLRRHWRRLRAGTLRRLGLLPPPGAPGAAATPQHADGYFRSNLQPDPEAVEVWHRLLSLTSEEPRGRNA